ncbi:MAG: hypothetical protein CMC08_09035 [Flavobacteriaceae bacterium]|nr:hypothetical protein [Flavobacteriaceae bacterium]
MAHENLRFNLHLSENKSPSTTPLSFGPIYSDTKYGSHYGLFANVQGRKLGGTAFEVSKIELFLQNYTGSVTIGISHILGIHVSEAIPADYKTRKEGGRFVQLFVCLQGLSTAFGKSVTLSENELVLTEANLLEVIIVFEPVANQFSMIDEPIEKRNASALFADPEYLERDGEDIFEIPAKADFRAQLNDLIQRGFRVTTDGEQSLQKEYKMIGDDKFCRMKVSNIIIQ